MNRIVSVCPVCASEMHITELTCSRCQTRVQSRFDRCRFCRLSSEHLQFLEMFLQCRGNLSAVGAEMGVSFPTVAKRLDSLLAALDLRADEEPPLVSVRVDSKEEDRRRILEMLDRGEISAEEATRRLRDL